MRKVLKNILSHGIVFVVSGIIFTIIGVYAATQIASSQVTYNNTTVDAALNDLYDKAASIECAEGYKKGNIAANGSYVCSPSICKRATTLHTEKCEQTSKYCAGDGYTQGSTITYGNLGTTGTLATGDAFDCDVNGDGNYDAATERFYYVTDVDTNTAFLIYYNHYVTTPVAYDTSGSNTNGPVTAIANLPTTTQWPNVSLTNSIRDIKDETGAVKKSGFDYGNKAARLITYQEINAGCYDGTTAITSAGGLSSKCKFLMENTKYSKSSNPTYGIWTETAISFISYYAWEVYGYDRDVYYYDVSDARSFGARPGIEVLKSNISY